MPDTGPKIHNVESSIHDSSSRGRLGSPDPIADAIRLLRPVPVVEAGLRAAGSWAVRFEPFAHVKLGVVVRGACWLALEGHEPIRLREGDLFLLGNPPPYTLASSPEEEPQAAEVLWDGATDGVVRLGAAAQEDTYLCGGRLSFDDMNASMLLDVLPAIVHVRAGDPRGRLLAHLGELLAAEVQTTAALGGSLVLDHLAQILFVHMLRAHAERASRPTGWLGALGTDGIGDALRAMHADVARDWTLAELAEVSRMSRSAFAASFKEQVGTPPLEYLIQWRMSLARDALRRGTSTISELTSATGYGSESAFSTAFRRVVGASPKHFRESARDPEPQPRSMSSIR